MPGDQTAKYLSRARYDVENDTEALNAVGKFINENISTFQAALTDQRFLTQLQNLNNLTINTFNCIRYMLSTKGIDLWVFYVAETAVNPEDLEAGMVEYNVLDRNTTIGSFLPMGTKFIQTRTDLSPSKLYNEICESYGLFEGSVFAGQNNPIKVMVDAMKTDEELVGQVGTQKTTYVNSILEFLNKDVRVITE
jgi:hypothetical protein